MAELNSSVNKFTVNTVGDNGKKAFTVDAPTTAGFAESTHHFAKTANDMGVFVYTNDVTSIKIWQKINGSWIDCGSTGGQLGFPWHSSFAWRDGATHMHVQLDGPNNANETIRIIKIEGNMFASFDGTTTNSVLLLNDSVVEDTDDDGDIEVTSGTGYNIKIVSKDNSWVGDATVTFNVPNEISSGVLILNNTEVLSFTSTWDGNKSIVSHTLTETPGRNDKFVLYFTEPQTYSGNVSDGAISGATVTDVATGETVTTDSNGDFTFSSKPAGEIEAEGGVDVVTGDAYVGKMKGNSKYTIISPLSTAAVEVAADQGISFDQAVDDILDNSAELFGIDFPKEDKLELLNKRFVDEAAAGNSKAVRGSALIAMIDATAEIVGESLTNMSDSVAGDLATDAVDGKRQAYKGIARLVSDAKALTDVEREGLSRPLAVDTQRVSNAVAIRKGAATASITLKNEREAGYREGISSLLESRSNELSEALSSKYEENYAITRIQSIAKTAKNEDKTALEGFKGQATETLAVATVDNSKLNQIGNVPNVVVEAVRSVTFIEDMTDLTFIYGAVSKSNPLPKDSKVKFSYFKELGTGTQLYYGTADSNELDLRRISDHFNFGIPAEGEAAFTKAKTMTFVEQGFKYTVNYNGIVVLKEEEKAEEPTADHLYTTGGLYSVGYSNSSKETLTWPDPKDQGYPQPTVAGGILSFGKYRLRPNALKAGTFEFSHATWMSYKLQEWIPVEGFVDNVLTIKDLNIGKATETFTITWTPKAGGGEGNGEESKSNLVPTTFADTVASSWAINHLNSNWDQQHSLVDEKGTATYVWGNSKEPGSAIKFVFKDNNMSNVYFHDEKSIEGVLRPITWNEPSTIGTNYEGTFTFQSIAGKGGAVVVTITNNTENPPKK